LFSLGEYNWGMRPSAKGLRTSPLLCIESLTQRTLTSFFQSPFPCQLFLRGLLLNFFLFLPFVRIRRPPVFCFFWPGSFPETPFPFSVFFSSWPGSVCYFVASYSRPPFTQPPPDSSVPLQWGRFFQHSAGHLRVPTPLRHSFSVPMPFLALYALSTCTLDYGEPSSEPHPFGSSAQASWVSYFSITPGSDSPPFANNSCQRSSFLSVFPVSPAVARFEIPRLLARIHRFPFAFRAKGPWLIEPLSLPMTSSHVSFFFRVGD